MSAYGFAFADEYCRLTTGSDACSWLQKMQVAKRVLIDEAPSQKPGLDELANAFIYLQARVPSHTSCLHVCKWRACP